MKTRCVEHHTLWTNFTFYHSIWPTLSLVTRMCVCVCISAINFMYDDGCFAFVSRSFISDKNFTGMTTLQNNISSTFNIVRPASPNSVHPLLSAWQRVNVGLIYVVRAQRVIFCFFFRLFFPIFDLPTCTKDFYHVNFYCVWFLPHFPLFTMWSFHHGLIFISFIISLFYIQSIWYIRKQMFLMHQE